MNTGNRHGGRPQGEGAVQPDSPNASRITEAPRAGGLHPGRASGAEGVESL